MNMKKQRVPVNLRGALFYFPYTPYSRHTAFAAPSSLTGGAI